LRYCATEQADGEGFEPTVDLAAHAGFQDRCLKPLGHPSDNVKTSLSAFEAFPS
jgi:hypothetical protein